LFSSLTNIPNLADADVDSNVLSQVDFNYYSVNDFRNSECIGQIRFVNASFSVIHSNIGSLTANYDKLTTILFNLGHNFHLIGLTETRLMTSKYPLVNTNIPDYKFISQPSLHCAAGAGFFVRSDCDFHIRDDLNSTTEDFECLWIEVHNKCHRNIVCSVIYRHPNGNFDNFSNYLRAAMDKISNEKKYCILMGDFNINLLNYESHTPTDEFINNLGVFCFQPHILQPTRNTDHTATLIDNIYFNSILSITALVEIWFVTYQIMSQIFFLLINKLSCSSSNQTIYSRNYSKFDEK
jgi:exonuclease III